ncbi:hypothetical protein [Nocardia sp. IFM 10818]
MGQGGLNQVVVPKFVTFVDALPKNPSGKILERESRSEYANLAAG